jgi:hypothetical protein
MPAPQSNSCRNSAKPPSCTDGCDVPKPSESCQSSGCCQPSVEMPGDVVNANDSALVTGPTACSKGCCGESNIPAQMPNLCGQDKQQQDICCAGPSCNESGDCEDADLSEPGSLEEDPNDPSCCRGKANPCCDASCLDRLAFRECDTDTISTGELNYIYLSRVRLTNVSQQLVHPRLQPPVARVVTMASLASSTNVLPARNMPPP